MDARLTLLAAALLAAAPAFAGAARAQEVLHFWHADQQATRMGHALANAGDVNGDGFDDVIAGGPDYDLSATITGSGSVRIWSGADGSLLQEHFGAAKNDNFGFSVAGVGDLNGDGQSEFIVGAWEIPSTGYVELFDGAEGLLFHVDGLAHQERFGQTVAGPGDVNGDGVGDFAVGAPDYDVGLSNRGRVRVYSGVDASLIYEVKGLKGGDNLGMALSVMGDLNGDGVRELVIGGTRLVELRSGSDGALLATLKGDPTFNDGFGWGVAVLGDADGDGVDDIAVGASQANGGNGKAYVFSGATKAILFSVDGIVHDSLGVVGAPGDVDGDGRADLLVGAPSRFDEYSHAIVWSGRTGRELYRFESVDLNDEFGGACGGAGDLDGDGHDDPIVGARQAFHRRGAEGTVTVFRGNDLWLQATPWIAEVGEDIDLEVRNGPPGGAYALFVTEVDGTPLFELLLVAGLDSLGEALLSDTVTADLYDHEFMLRAYALPAGGGRLIDSFDERISIR